MYLVPYMNVDSCIIFLCVDVDCPYIWMYNNLFNQPSYISQNLMQKVGIHSISGIKRFSKGI